MITELPLVEIGIREDNDEITEGLRELCVKLINQKSERFISTVL